MLNDIEYQTQTMSRRDYIEEIYDTIFMTT